MFRGVGLAQAMAQFLEPPAPPLAEPPEPPAPPESSDSVSQPEFRPARMPRRLFGRGRTDVVI